jgi:hypothetical protein
MVDYITNPITGRLIKRDGFTHQMLISEGKMTADKPKKVKKVVGKPKKVKAKPVKETIKVVAKKPSKKLKKKKDDDLLAQQLEKIFLKELKLIEDDEDTDYSIDDIAEIKVRPRKTKKVVEESEEEEEETDEEEEEEEEESEESEEESDDDESKDLGEEVEVSSDED